MSTPAEYTVRQLLPSIAVECYAGTELRFSVPVLMGNDAPANVASIQSARAQVRTRWESPDVLHSWTTDDPAGMTLGGGAAAAVTIVATGEETAIWQQQWPRLAVVWDLEVVDADGKPRRLCRSSPFTVYPEITREL